MADKKESLFTTLNAINVNDHTEQRKNLTYLSWSWAWTELMKVCPEAKYEVIKFDGRPYLFDEKLGYMVFTKITIGDDTKEMWLPVMDGANKAMTDHPYKYRTKTGEMTCNAATMFDINKTIMRCLTKNISMFGLGLYIYAGEDLPEADEPQSKSDIFDEPLPQSKPKENVRSLKILADEFRKLVPAEAQSKILADFQTTKAEDLGTINLQKYVNYYGQKSANQS